MVQDLRIRIKIDSDTGELLVTKKELDKLGNTIQSVSNKSKTFGLKTKESFDIMAHSAQGLIGWYQILNSTVVDTAKSFIQTADHMTNVTNRLSLVTKSTEDLINAQKELFNVAQNARVDLGETIDLYARIARSTQSLNISQKELIGITDTISKTLIISGGSAESMNAALIQLGQGFASGTLRGEELNSILEQTPRLAEAIANGMGITIGQLRDYGKEGKLSSEAIITALKNQASVVGREFDQMSMTVSQSQTKVANSFSTMIANIDNATGITDDLAKSISDLSKSIDTNMDDIVDASRWTYASIGWVIDQLDLYYETIENTLQRLVYGFNALVYDSLKGISELIVPATEALNKVGLSSSETLKEAYSFAEFANKQYIASLDGIKESEDELASVLESAAVTIQDRYDLMVGMANIVKPVKKAQDDLSKSTQTFTEFLKAQSDELKNYKDVITGFKDIDTSDYYFFGSLDYSIDGYTKLLEQYNELLQSDLNPTQFKQVQDQYEENVNKLNDYFEDRFKYSSDLVKDQAKEIETTFDQVAKNMYQSFDDYFFNAMKDGFGDLKDLGKNLLSGITDPLYRNISGALSQVVTPATNNATTVDTSLLSGQGFTQGSNGTYSLDTGNGVISVNSSGLVTQGASLLSGNSTLSTALNMMTLPNTLSSINTFLTNPSSFFSGVQGFITDPMGQLSNALSGLNTGLTNLGVNLGFLQSTTPQLISLGNGFTVPASSLYGSSLTTLGAGALGAVGGFALGSIGDMLFGADTKAGIGGALGGALGGVLGTTALSASATAIGSQIGLAGGPLGAIAGAIIGSLIGGIFGEWKVKDTGFYLDGNASSSDSISSYVFSKKKSWFSTKSKLETPELDEATKNLIDNLFDSYNGLLEYFANSKEMILKIDEYGQTLTGTTLIDAVFPKEFFSNLMGIPVKIVEEYQDNVFQILTNDSEQGWEKLVSGTVTKERLVDNPALTRIYDSWKYYADALEEEITDVIVEAFTTLKVTDQAIDTLKLNNTGIDGTTIFKTSNVLEALKNESESMFDVVGYANADRQVEFYTTMIKLSQDAIVDYAKMAGDNIKQWYVDIQHETLATYEQKLKEYEALQDFNAKFDLKNFDLESFEAYKDAIMATEPTSEMVESLTKYGEALAELNEIAQAGQAYIDSYNSLKSPLDAQGTLDKALGEYKKSYSAVYGGSEYSGTLEEFLDEASTKWDTLSNALKTKLSPVLKEAVEAFNILNQIRLDDANELLTQLSTLTTTLNNITLAKNRYNGFETTFAMVDEAIANGTDANLIIGMVDEAYNNSIAKQQELYTAQLDSLNSLVEVAQNFKSYAIDLKALADDLSMSVMQNSDKGDFISSRLYGAIGSYKTAVTNKEDASAYYSDITKYTPLYQDYLKSTMTNRYDYEFQIQKLSNELYGLADISDATLGDVEDSIADLESSNEKVINDLKDRALQSLNYLSLDITNDIKSVRDTLNANVPNYESWWGASSPIVTAIKEALDINMQAVTQAQESVIVDTSSVHYDTNSQEDLQSWFDTAKSNYETFAVTGAVDGWTLSELGQLVTFAREVADTGTRAGSLSFEVWEDWYTSVRDWANQTSGTHKFANGGIINAPTTFGIAGEAGYPEMITPLKNPNDPLGATSLLNAIEKLDNRLANLEQMAIKRTADTRNIKKQGDRYEIERAATA
jgi:tape measure domain-containing protein